MADAPPLARYVAEFMGTYLLVLTIGCNVLSGQPVWAGVSIASVLMVMIYSLGKTSGGHFNPAVTIAVGLAGKMKETRYGGWKEVAIYIVVQLLGGIAAGVSYLVMFGKSFNLAPVGSFNWFQAGIAELIYTFMLCFVVLNVATSKKHAGNNQFYGLAIGFVIVAGAYSGGSVSMGCFNPAVAFGIDISSAYFGVKYSFVYAAFELVGAVVAVALFKACRPEERDTLDNNVGIPEPPLGCKLLSEFLGTFILVTTIGLNILTGSAAGAFSIAAALMCMIYALGSISGAHFNPAVTTAVLVSNHTPLKPREGAFYMGAQVTAGICSGLVLRLFGVGEVEVSSAWWQIVFVELVFTTVLALVVLSVATVRKSNAEYGAFAIGSCVTLGGFAAGKISGGALNPAVAIGLQGWGMFSAGVAPLLVYSITELLAGVFAAVLFAALQPKEVTDGRKVVKMQEASTYANQSAAGIIDP